MRQPYDSVKTQRQNTRLKSELRKVNDDLKLNQTSKTSRLGPGLDNIESTLKLIGKLQEENNKLKREILLLKRKSDRNENKDNIIENMGWLGEQVIEQSSKMHQLINKVLIEFEDSVKGEEGDTKRE